MPSLYRTKKVVKKNTRMMCQSQALDTSMILLIIQATLISIKISTYLKKTKDWMSLSLRHRQCRQEVGCDLPRPAFKLMLPSRLTRLPKPCYKHSCLDSSVDNNYLKFPPLSEPPCRESGRLSRPSSMMMTMESRNSQLLLLRQHQPNHLRSARRRCRLSSSPFYHQFSNTMLQL